MSLADDDLLVPLLFEPKIGELVPLPELGIGADATGGQLVLGVLGLVCRQDVGEESKGHNDADKEEFFKKKEDDGQQEGDREDRGVELAGADFVGAGGSAPVEQDFFYFDVFGDSFGLA